MAFDHGKGGWFLTGIFGGIFFRDDDLIPRGKMGQNSIQAQIPIRKMPVYHDISLICHDITGNLYINGIVYFKDFSHDQFFPAIPQGF